MQLYSWVSERFASHTDGMVLALAKDVKDARRKIMREHDRTFGRNSGFEYERSQLEDDISKPPSLAHVHFIYGSD